MRIVATEKKAAASCRFIQPSAFVDVAKPRTIADKAVLPQFHHFMRHSEAFEVGPGTIEAESHSADFSRSQITFDWPEQAHRNIRLAVNQIGAS